MTLQDLNYIHTAVIHCSATPEGHEVTAEDVDEWHRARGWSMIGYHDLIQLNGTTERGRPYTRRGCHVKGNNINTIGICMVGGLNEEGDPTNTFTDAQWSSLIMKLLNAREICPNLRQAVGHRSYSPDLNGDGLITPDEWIKACPCFSVTAKLKEWHMDDWLAAKRGG